MNKLMLTLTLGALMHSQIHASENLNKLDKGNQRFIAGETHFTEVSIEERKNLSEGQTPFATILTCSDSRVPPEIIFDQEPGDLFIVRVAGNVVDQLGLGTIEYGIAVLKIPVLMIMGHQNCGAVEAAFHLGEADFSTNIAALLTQIKPATRSVKQQYPNKSPSELLDLAIKKNVSRTHQEIINRSPIVRKHLADGSLEIVDAVFNIETGKVTIINEKSPE